MRTDYIYPTLSWRKGGIHMHMNTIYTEIFKQQFKKIDYQDI